MTRPLTGVEKKRKKDHEAYERAAALRVWALDYYYKIHNKTHKGMTTIQLQVKYDYNLPQSKRDAFQQLKTEDVPCEACQATSTERNHPSSKNDSESNMFWTGDVATNFPPSRRGNTMFYEWVSPLGYIEAGYGKHKNEVFAWTASNHKIWHMEEPFMYARTDRGGEYVSYEFEQWFKDHGIYHSKTPPNSSRGKAERMIRTLKNLSKAYIYNAKAPYVFWDEAMLFAVQVQNRTPSFSKHYKYAEKRISPFEARYGKPPDLTKLHRWGCLCFAHDGDTTTYGETGRRCAFMGLATGPKGGDQGYRLWTGKSIIHSNSVSFNERKSYWDFCKPKRISPTPNDSSPIETCFNPLCKGKAPGEHSPSCEFHPEYWGEEEEIFPSDDEDEVVSEPRARTQTQTFDPQGFDAAYEHDKMLAEHANVVLDVKSQDWGEDKAFGDVILNTQQHIEHSHLVIESLESIKENLSKLEPSVNGQRRAFELINNAVDSSKKLEEIAHRYNERGQLKSTLIPNNEKELQDSEDKKLWIAAKLKEMEMLTKLRTFAKILRSSMPPNRKTITARWVYDIKKLADGTIERYKARLVARVFLQRQGLDYTESFAATPDLVSIRLILAYALEKGWDVAQFDISSAFLNSELPDDETVFVEPPPDWNLSKKYVLQLKKCLYGLVQASRRWYLHISSKFKQAGFKASGADQCVFIHRNNSSGEVDCVSGVHTDDASLLEKHTRSSQHWICSRVTMTSVSSRATSMPLLE